MDSESAEKERQQAGVFSHLLQAPVDFLFQSLRPYTPNLVSLFVFLFLIPFLVFLSLSAGIVVWRNVAVGWQIPLYLQYGDGVQPYAVATLPQLSVHQPYDVILHLEVPATEANFALGNFMSSLRLATNTNKTLATVRRPAIAISPKASYFSSRPNLVNIEIPMLDSFTPGTTQLQVEVKIGRDDVWKGIGNGEGRELSVYSISLKGILVHKGPRGLVTRFPTIFSVICSGIFFAILFSILAGCLLPSILQSSSSEDDQRAPEEKKIVSTSLLEVPEYPQLQSDIESEDSEMDEDEHDDEEMKREEQEEEEDERKSFKSSRRRRRRNKGKNTSEESSVKSEFEPVVMPSSSRSTTPLRRRRSKPSADMDS